MTQFIETTGRTQEDAIAAALAQLGKDRDDVSVEVVDRAKPGFLGFGGNPAKVRVSYDDGKPEILENNQEEENKSPEKPVEPSPPWKETDQQATHPETTAEKPTQPEKIVEKKTSPKVKKPENTEKTEDFSTSKTEKVENKGSGDRRSREALSTEEAQQVESEILAFLQGLFTHLHVEATPQITQEQGDFQVKLSGQNLGALIGRRGETLDSIQQLTSYVVNKNHSKRVRIFLDAENYRAKREETLQKLAEKVAGEAVKHRRNVVLESMNAYERHIIHAALQDVPNISTYSTGSDPNRRTVVCYNPKK